MIQDTSVNKWGWLYALLFVVILIVVVYFLTLNVQIINNTYVSKQTQNSILCNVPISQGEDGGPPSTTCWTNNSTCPSGGTFLIQCNGNILQQCQMYAPCP